MRVALVAQPLERVPPVRSGAVEMIISLLTEGLAARGHEVTLFASGDSVTTSRLVAPVPRAIEHDLDYQGQHWWPQSIQLGQVVDMEREFEVINSHAGYWFLPALRALQVPVVTTWHGYVHRVITRSILKAHAHASLIAVSEYQRHATSDLSLNWLETIHHGIPEADVVFSDRIGTYLLFLGRVSPVKRPHLAIRVALAAGMPIRVAGPIEDLDYFETVIRPLLRHPDVEFVGECIGEDKRRLLSDALALVHTPAWESFGLSVIEALGSGTPAICPDRCSLPELVDHGVTGFVCQTTSEMRDACLRVAGLDRASCKAAFDQRFTVGRMLDAYEACLQRVAAGAQK
jgi:glycosyltransferase involved in cell wall biosynthesis